MKETCTNETARSLIKYLPANENPPEHGVCKQYLEYIMEVMNVLEIKEIFVHADEQVYARICQLIWKYKDKFKSVVPLMGGFHQLGVFQKILYKRYAVFVIQLGTQMPVLLLKSQLRRPLKVGTIIGPCTFTRRDLMHLVKWESLS